MLAYEYGQNGLRLGVRRRQVVPGYSCLMCLSVGSALRTGRLTARLLRSGSLAFALMLSAIPFAQRTSAEPAEAAFQFANPAVKSATMPDRKPAKVSKVDRTKSKADPAATNPNPATSAIPAAPVGNDTAAKDTAVTFNPVRFEDLPGWQQDDHLVALQTFMRSCARITAARTGSRNGDTPPSDGLLSACETASKLISGKPTKASARAFFETNFLPHRVVHAGTEGLMTGYYEPVIAGSRKPDAAYQTPLLKRPDDLVNLVPESERGAKADKLTHGRKTASGFEAYPTRQQIEEGALVGRNLELLYLQDPVDVFFMQVQGSGLIALPDGSQVRVTYDGKNGHPYTSIGRYIIDKGWFPADRMSLGALKEWLRQNPDKAKEVLWQNRSYVFFRELQGEQAGGPIGVNEIPLTPGRSIAVDTRYHAIGTPVYVSAPQITHITSTKRPFERLMIAQDVGSAIRGPERGDIYCGSGDAAGRRAGVTKHPGNFYVLLPRDRLRGPQIEAQDRKVMHQASQ